MDVGLLQASVGQILLQYNKYRPNIYNIYIYFFTSVSIILSYDTSCS